MGLAAARYGGYWVPTQVPTVRVPKYMNTWTGWCVGDQVPQWLLGASTQIRVLQLLFKLTNERRAKCTC